MPIKSVIRNTRIIAIPTLNIESWLREAMTTVIRDTEAPIERSMEAVRMTIACAMLTKHRGVNVSTLDLNALYEKKFGWRNALKNKMSISTNTLGKAG
jgi:hypothetical protein